MDTITPKQRAEALLGLRFRPLRRDLAPEGSHHHRVGFSICPGWLDLVVEFGRFLESEGLSDQVVIIDVSEKFGELRIHFSGFEDRKRNQPIWEKAKQLRKHSTGICELCGAEGTLSEDGGIKTCCPDHQDTRWRYDDVLIERFWAMKLPQLERLLGEVSAQEADK